jgi:hypothetical protein
VLADLRIDMEPEGFSLLGGLNGSVFDLHRIDLLEKVGGVALDVDSIADVKDSLGQLDDSDADLRKIMRNAADFFLHPVLLPEYLKRN